ncbi:hypothetical protein ACR03S_03560 [Limimaricola variabilis]
MTLTPLMKRVALAKSLGLMFGLVAPILLTPVSAAETMLVWGIVLWAVILGALVGLAGQFDRVPLIDLRLPSGFRGGWIGLWMGIVLLLVAQQPLGVIWARLEWLPQPGPGVWWLVAEATLLGALIDLAVTAVSDPPIRDGGQRRPRH